MKEEEDILECVDCGKTVSRDSEYRDESGCPICESYAEHYFTCGDCDRIIHEEHGTWIAGIDVLVCDSCLDDRYYRCEDCGRYVSEDDSYGLGPGGRICHNCYERSDYNRCCDCGALYRTSDLNASIQSPFKSSGFSVPYRSSR